MPTLRSEYLHCVGLVHKLHRLIQEGQGDETEADDIREELTNFDRRFSELERRRLNRLSGDLYTLYKDNSGSEPASPTTMAVFRDILRTNDGDDLLDLLVKHPLFGTPLNRASLRIMAYCWMGDQATANLFVDRVSQLHCELSKELEAGRQKTSGK